MLEFMRLITQGIEEGGDQHLAFWFSILALWNDLDNGRTKVHLVRPEGLGFLEGVDFFFLSLAILYQIEVLAIPWTPKVGVFHELPYLQNEGEVGVMFGQVDLRQGFLLFPEQGLFER